MRKALYAIALAASFVAATSAKADRIDDWLNSKEHDAVVACMTQAVFEEANKEGVAAPRVNRFLALMHFDMKCAEQHAAFMDLVGDDETAGKITKMGLDALLITLAKRPEYRH